MQNLTLDQFRATVDTGGVVSVILKAAGSGFAIQAETRRGDVVLVDSRRKQPRLFGDPRRALALLRGMGIRKVSVDAVDWQPDQPPLLRPGRPDRKAAMREAHEAADLKRTLEARIAAADSPVAVWHDHEQVFDELETSLAC